MSMTSPTKFCHTTQIILWMWSCGHLYKTSYHNLNFIRIWPEKPLFWGAVFVQVHWFGTGTRYKLEILHQSVRGAKTKIQKVLGPHSYVYRSYRGKTGKWGLFGPFSILNRVKEFIECIECIGENKEKYKHFSVSFFELEVEYIMQFIAMQKLITNIWKTMIEIKNRHIFSIGM